jgi:hypothetical protein
VLAVSLLDSIGDALHPARSAKDRRFVAIKVNRIYVDVGGGSEHTAIVAGAYVAGQPTWRRFGVAWRDVLRDAGARVFHATDFFQCRGEFAHITLNSPEHLELAKRFVGVARRHTAAGFAFGLHQRAYDELIAPELARVGTSHAHVTIEGYAILTCLMLGAQFGLPRDSGRTAAVILEDGPGMGATIELLNHIKALGEEWTTPYLSFTTMAKSQYPLQSADLLAYEGWKKITDVFEGAGRDTRKSLTALIEKLTVNVSYAGEDELTRFKPYLRRFLRNHPDYEKRPQM